MQDSCRVTGSSVQRYWAAVVGATVLVVADAVQVRTPAMSGGPQASEPGAMGVEVAGGRAGPGIVLVACGPEGAGGVCMMSAM